MTVRITDDELKYIYANAPVEKERFEVVVISCEWFTETFYLQYAFGEDIEVTLDDGSVVTAQYAPMASELSESTDDVSFERKLTIMQANDLIANQIALRDPVLHKGIYPTLASYLYVMYRDGTVSALKSTPVKTLVLSVSRTTEGAVLSTSTSPVNQASTGEVATVSRVPMLEPYV